MTEQQPPKIYAAMSQVMGAVGHISKTRKNQQQGYAFRGIDDIYAALQQPMVEAGVFCVPQVIETTVVERATNAGGRLLYTTLKVKHIFYAVDGSSIEVVTVGEAMDSGDKSSNKAMSAAMKYAMIEVFCIPTEGDNDTENQTHELAKNQPTNAPAQNNSGQHRTVTKPAAAPPAAVQPPANVEPPGPPRRAGKAICEQVYAELINLSAHDFALAMWKETNHWEHRLQLLDQAVAACKSIIDSNPSRTIGQGIIAGVLNNNAGNAMAALIQLQKAANGEADAISAATKTANELHHEGVL